MKKIVNKRRAQQKFDQAFRDSEYERAYENFLVWTRGINIRSQREFQTALTDYWPTSPPPGLLEEVYERNKDAYYDEDTFDLLVEVEYFSKDDDRIRILPGSPRKKQVEFVSRTGRKRTVSLAKARFWLSLRKENWAGKKRKKLKKRR